MNKQLKVAALACCMALAGAAGASDIKNLDANAIRAQQAEIRTEASARKGPYQRLGDDKLVELRNRQDEVARLLAGNVQRTTDLSEGDQIALFNALESIEGIENQAENQRMICERHKPTGSKRPVTTCRTAAQRKAEREESMKDFGKRNLECDKTAMACL